MYLLLTVYSMRRHTSKMHYKEDDLVGHTHCSLRLRAENRKLREAQSTKGLFRMRVRRKCQCLKKTSNLTFSHQLPLKHVHGDIFIQSPDLILFIYIYDLCFNPCFVSCRWNALYSSMASLNTQRRVRSNSTLSKFIDPLRAWIILINH